MKRVVSISLGSSRRNHSVELAVLGERVTVERIGTDGHLGRAIELIRSMDGQVDAFGMGGIDLYIWAGQRRYQFREARQIARAAVRTPIVDGSGLKNTLERRVVQYLADHQVLPLRGARVLMVAAVDRFGMAEALAAAGCELVCGDLMFALGLPVPIRSLRSLDLAARVLAPLVTQMPIRMLYPTGERQEQATPKFTSFFTWADIIAGDFHFIRRYMPARLDGKAVLTNTVTPADVADLQARGVATLITTTPNLGGRSFGTNVMEGLVLAMSGKRPEDMRPQDYLDWLDRLDFQPRIERFGAARPGCDRDPPPSAGLAAD